MVAFGCSEQVIEPNLPSKPTIANPAVQITTPVEYPTNVTTWMVGQGGSFIGLVTKTPSTDLAKVEVFVIRNGERIAIDRKLDQANMITAHSTFGEYYWASFENKVLLINFIGALPETMPPFPLDVIIKYD